MTKEMESNDQGIRNGMRRWMKGINRENNLEQNRETCKTRRKKIRVGNDVGDPKDKGAVN